MRIMRIIVPRMRAYTYTYVHVHVHMYRMRIDMASYALRRFSAFQESKSSTIISPYHNNLQQLSYFKYFL